MVVITLEKCPLALRGDLTKWLQEISLGVYVGTVSARVRDQLWHRVCEEAKSGRATMVYSARNEQHFDFRVHNTTWYPVDFDGLKLMMRPSVSSKNGENQGKAECSNASRFQKIKKFTYKKVVREPSAYVVVDIETTGLDFEHDEIIEVAAIKIINGEETDTFQSLIATEKSLSDDIQQLTGLTNSLLNISGRNKKQVIEELIEFIGALPVIAHNAAFDCEFIQIACEECDLEDFDNQRIDTLELARKKLPGVSSFQLASLAKQFGIEVQCVHRALADCETTRSIYLKLIEK